MIASRFGRVAGFTLIEVMLVLAVVGILSSLILVGVGRGSESRGERALIGQIERALVMARVEAMRSRSEREVVLRFEGEQAALVGMGQEDRLPSGGLRAIDERGLAVNEVTVRFGADGRTETRLWRLAGAGMDAQRAHDLGLLTDGLRGPDELLQGRGRETVVGSGIAGRLWLVRFDPVSGVPRLHTVGPG